MGSHRTITVNECNAIPYLAAAGHSHATIGQMYGVRGVTISKHARGDCDHPRLDAPLEPSAPTGDALRQLRLAHGYTQRGLADELGVSPTTVSQWERGEKKPRTRNAWRLERCLCE